MSELRKKIETLVNSGKGKGYVISSLALSGENSPEKKDQIIKALVDLACSQKEKVNGLEEKYNDHALTLNQVTAAYEEFCSMHLSGQ